MSPTTHDGCRGVGANQRAKTTQQRLARGIEDHRSILKDRATRKRITDIGDAQLRTLLYMRQQSPCLASQRPLAVPRQYPRDQAAAEHDTVAVAILENSRGSLIRRLPSPGR